MIVALIIAGCVLCYTVQGFFNRMFATAYSGPGEMATPVFASIYGFFCAIMTLFYNKCVFDASVYTWVLGIVNGITLFIYNRASIESSRRGSFAFLNLMKQAGSIILPTLCAALIWHDNVKIITYVGVVVMLIALALFSAKQFGIKKAQKGYYIWTFILMLVNGLYSCFMSAQQRLNANTQRCEMIILTFFFSALVSIIYIVFVVVKNGQPLRNAIVPFKMNREAFLYLALSTLGATIAVNMLMSVMGKVADAILFTANNGGVLIFSCLLGIIVLEEKLNTYQILSLLLSVVSIVLLSL